MIYQVLTRENLRRSRVWVFVKDFLVCFLGLILLGVAVLCVGSFIRWQLPDLESWASVLFKVLRVLVVLSIVFAWVVNHRSWLAEQEKK